MNQPLFLNTDLEFDGQDKYAGLLVPMSDNSDEWPAQLVEEVHRQHPYLSNYDVDVVLDAVNEDQGFAYGSVVVRPRSDMTQHEYEAADMGPEIHAVAIIREGKLAPFDVFIDGKSFHPMTEDRVGASLFQPQAFDVTRERPPESSMYTDIQPPLESSTGVGGGGVKLGSEKTANELIGRMAQQYQMDPGYLRDYVYQQGVADDVFEHNVAAESDLQRSFGGPGVRWDTKRWGGPNPIAVKPAAPQKAAILPKLAGLVSEDDLSRFKNAYATDLSLQHAVKQGSDGVKVAFASALGLEGSASPEKVAEFALASIPPETVQLTKLHDGNFLVKWANAGFYAPQQEQVDPMTAQELMEGDDMVQQMEPDQSITMSTNAVVKQTTADDEVKVIDQFGLWSVQDSSGCDITGFVFPNILSWDLVQLPLTLFTNGSQYACQESIAGRLVGKSTELPNARPQGYGCFYKVDGGTARAFKPMQITTGFRGPDGEWRFVGETITGEEVTLCPVEGLKKPVNMGTEICIPSDYKWMPLKGETELVQEPGGFMKYAFSGIGEIISDGSVYTFRGLPFTKIAKEQRHGLNRQDAEFLGVCAGIHPDFIKEALDKTHSGDIVEIPYLTQLQNPLDKVAEQRAKVEKLAADVPRRFFLMKEASVMESAVTADSVLSLGFLNPENVSVFVDMIPKFEESLSDIAEMLTASRMGLKDVPEVALERAMVALDNVVTGLRRLREKEISYL